MIDEDFCCKNFFLDKNIRIKDWILIIGQKSNGFVVFDEDCSSFIIGNPIFLVFVRSSGFNAKMIVLNTNF